MVADGHDISQADIEQFREKLRRLTVRNERDHSAYRNAGTLIPALLDPGTTLVTLMEQLRTPQLCRQVDLRQGRLLSALHELQSEGLEHR